MCEKLVPWRIASSAEWLTCQAQTYRRQAFVCRGLALSWLTHPMVRTSRGTGSAVRRTGRR